LKVFDVLEFFAMGSLFVCQWLVFIVFVCISVIRNWAAGSLYIYLWKSNYSGSGQ